MQAICERLNSARLPCELTAVTVTLSQFSSPWKVASNSPELSVVAVVCLLSRPLAESVTFSPGWNPVPLTSSGCGWTGVICARDAVVLAAAVSVVAGGPAEGSWPQPPAASATSASAALVRHRATTGRGRVLLLVGAVRAPHQRAGEDGAEAEGFALLAEPAELVRVHPAVDRRVLRTRLEVLPDRDDIDAVLPQVAHRLHDLVVRLAEADDDPGLRQHRVVGELLRPLEQPERLVVARLRAAHPGVQPPHGLDVVVEDVGPLREDGAKRVLLDVEEVGSQDLDRRPRHLVLQRADRRRVVAGAAVGDVVAVDGGDDDVLEVHLRGRRREPQRLERVRRRVRLAGVDVAIAACARARVSEDLEGGGPAAPALRDVRAAGLLADRVQRGAVDQLLDVEVGRVLGRRAHLHPFGAARALGDGKRLLHLATVY